MFSSYTDYGVLFHSFEDCYAFNWMHWYHIFALYDSFTFGGLSYIEHCAILTCSVELHAMSYTYMRLV